MSELEVLPSHGRHRVPDPDPDEPATGTEAPVTDLEPAPAGTPTLVRTIAPDVTATLQAAPTALLLLDLDGTVVAGNTAAEGLTGRTGTELAGTPLAVLVPELAGAQLVAALDRALAGHPSTVATRLVRGDGRDLPAVLSVAPVPDAAGRPTHLVLHVDDRTEQTAREARLVHRAFHDPLTGLPHRTLFLDTLHQAVAAAHERGTSTCVLVLEVGGLAEIDALHGHAAGDRAAVELARRLRSAVRAVDTTAALAPGTFAVLCENTEAAQGATVAERLCALTSGPVEALAGAVELVTTVRVSSVQGADDPATAFAVLLTATGPTATSPRGAWPPPRPVSYRR